MGGEVLVSDEFECGCEETGTQDRVIGFILGVCAALAIVGMSALVAVTLKHLGH